MIDIPLHKVLMDDSALAKVKETMYSGSITEGPRVKEFEAQLEEHLGTKVLAVNSCTSAIDLALQLIGVGPGDEVISTPMTCAATNTHVVLRGAKLVWADVDPNTGNIDAESINKLVSEKTKAIIVVDWGGRPVDLRGIKGFFSKGIPIIQDAAHSFMARAEGGALVHSISYASGDYVAWSFQAIKHLTTGDGGALKVPTDQIDRARRLRWFGIDRDTPAKFRFLQDIPEAGYKYHMNDITASIGIANLPSAVRSVGSYRFNASLLYGMLEKKLSIVKLPPPSVGSSWWFFSLRTPKWQEFVEFAESKGIGAGPVHGRNDHYTAHGKSAIELPGVDYYSSHHVAVPCGWWVDVTGVERIANMIGEWDKKLCNEF